MYGERGGEGGGGGGEERERTHERRRGREGRSVDGMTENFKYGI